MDELREFEKWVKHTENEWRPALLVVQQYIRERSQLPLRDDGQAPLPLREMINV